MIKKISLYTLIIILTVVQSFILINLESQTIDKDLSYNNSYSITNLKNVKYIKEIIKNLENNNTLTILSYNKLEDNNWKLKCNLKGTKEEVFKEIENLSYYNIISYSLNYENKNVLLELELISK